MGYPTQFNANSRPVLAGILPDPGCARNQRFALRSFQFRAAIYASRQSGCSPQSGPRLNINPYKQKYGRFLANPLSTDAEGKFWIDKLVLRELKIAVAFQWRTVHFVMGV